jgi:hypothetical protein
MIDVLFGGVFGGLLRLAPEVLKFFDKKNERQHELLMLDKEMEFAKVKGEIMMHQVEAQMQISELDAISKAFDEQSNTASKAGWFIAGVSALVRPLITYAFVSAYFAVKFAAFSIAIEQGGLWKEVIINLWTQDDVTVLFMIISFWFVGRVWEKTRK